MVTNNLTPMAKKVVTLLKENGIEECDLLNVLSNIFHDCKNNITLTISIEENYYNLLKDMVWYNLERKNNNNTLIDFGTQYKRFMFSCEEDNVINNEDVGVMKWELINIREKFSKKDILLINLSGNENDFNEKTPIHFVDKRKDSSKKNTRKKKDELLCVIKDSLSAYKMEQIKINSLLNEMISALEKAEANNTEVRIDFIA